jgi:O-antigen/teichoic acid export membrane protein
MITIPYISRVIGSTGVGINGFTNSIIQYFILFGTIGITLYGNRTIAYVRDDINQLSNTFWSVFSLQIIMSSISYCVFLFFLQLNSGNYYVFYLIQSIFLIAAAVDISWLFMGLEDFKKIVIRNTIVRLLGVIAMFVFVKDSSDLWKYIFILAISQLLGQLTMWAYVPKVVKIVKIKWSDIGKHLFPSLSLFLPQIAIQIYLVLNKTMLGYFSSPAEVGIFDYSDKVIKMVLAVVTAMGVVMLPRVANTFAQGNIKKVNEYLYQSFNFASYLSIPMTFGLIGVAHNFVPWFFGMEFIKSETIIYVICPIIVFIAWNTVLGQQYLMPTGAIKGYTISVIVGAVINFILNLLLISSLKSIGTGIATVVAEFMVTFVQLLFVSQKIQIVMLFKDVWKYITASIIMCLIIGLLGTVLTGNLFLLVLQVVLGVVIYFVLLTFFRAEMNKIIFKKLISLVRKKRSI